RRASRRLARGPGGTARPVVAPLGVEPADELAHLRPVLVPGLLHDRGDLGIGGELPPALDVPVEDRPEPVFLVGIAEDGRALRSVELALLGALRRVDLDE